MASTETVQSENRECARRELAKYRANCDIYRQLLVILENADSRLLSVTAQQSETKASSAAHDAFADQIACINESINKLGIIINEITRSLDIVLGHINALVESDPDCARILSKKYLEPNCAPTYLEIAEDMGYSEAWVKQKHTKGLDFVYERISESR